MGKRSTIEATVGILSAFLRRRTWQQAELAREIELEPRALRRHLNELTRRGFPLEREEEPPQVYWSMPKDWFPGGLLLDAAEAQLLIQLLCRMPASKARDALLRRASAGLPKKDNPVERLETVLGGLGSEAPFLELVTEAASRREALHLNYFSATRGALEWRHVSVQRVLPGAPARMVVHCHRSGGLKWFRVDAIVDARLDASVSYHARVPGEVDEYLSTSLDGFASDEAPIEHRFFVADPDARWVLRNLLPSMTAEIVPGGVRVVSRTSASVRLARFVLSLAPLARAESPELAALVMDLATAAVTQHQRAKAIQGNVTRLHPSQTTSPASAPARSSRKRRG